MSDVSRVERTRLSKDVFIMYVSKCICVSSVSRMKQQEEKLCHSEPENSKVGQRKRREANEGGHRVLRQRTEEQKGKRDAEEETEKKQPEVEQKNGEKVGGKAYKGVKRKREEEEEEKKKREGEKQGNEDTVKMTEKKRVEESKKKKKAEEEMEEKKQLDNKQRSEDAGEKRGEEESAKQKYLEDEKRKQVGEKFDPPKTLLIVNRLHPFFCIYEINYMCIKTLCLSFRGVECWRRGG